MDVVLLHNAKAGNESWSRRDLIKLVRRAGYTPRYYPLRLALDDPTLLKRGEFVIVAGGDGAIRKAALAMIGLGKPLAPLPLGTANNIVRSFELPLRIEDLIDGWRKPRRRPFDVGVAEGPWGRRHFIEGVGVGLISRSIAVIDEIDEEAVYELKKAKHKLHRDICVAAALAREMHPLPAHLSFDGRDVSGDFLLLEILNIRRAGPGLELAPHASPSDGRFDVVSATVAQRPRLLRTLKARLKDSGEGGNMTTRRARHVHFEVHVPCEMRIDDGTVHVEANTVVEMTIKSGALEFLLPAK
jgi:diacylglycerol kinase family enzyme